MILIANLWVGSILTELICEYKNYEFSDDDYKVANWLFENEKAVYSYLATCSGHLWKYDITEDKVTLVSSDIPFDENDPYIKTRKGK